MSEKKKNMPPVTVTIGSSYDGPHTTAAAISTNSVQQNGASGTSVEGVNCKRVAAVLRFLASVLNAQSGRAVQ
jgi:hypothetical protein